MTRRPSRRDNDRIAQRRTTGQIDRDDVFGFVVVEGGENARQKRRFRGRGRRVATQLYAWHAAQGRAPSYWSVTRSGSASGKARNSWRFPICAAAEPLLHLRI